MFRLFRNTIPKKSKIKISNKKSIELCKISEITVKNINRFSKFTLIMYLMFLLTTKCDIKYVESNIKLWVKENKILK